METNDTLSTAGIGRCKDCKWAVATPDARNSKYLTCDSPKLFKGYGYSRNEIVADNALVEDDEGWGIVVGPDFGCVNFEVAPSEDSSGS